MAGLPELDPEPGDLHGVQPLLQAGHQHPPLLHPLVRIADPDLAVSGVLVGYAFEI